MYEDFVTGKTASSSVPVSAELLLGLLARKLAEQQEQATPPQTPEPAPIAPVSPSLFLAQPRTPPSPVRSPMLLAFAIIAFVVAAISIVAVLNGLTVTPDGTTVVAAVNGTSAPASAAGAKATPTLRIVVPTQRVDRNSSSVVVNVPNNDVPAAAATATVQPTAAATTTPAPECVLITWLDGSQSCDDGRAIDAAHSQPGYCTPTVWGDGSVSCDDGKPSGKVVWPDPEIQDEPTNTPWPAAPPSDVQWTVSDGPSNNTCVTVGGQTACSEPNVKLDQDDAAFVARMIVDGRIEQGAGTPKG